MHNVILNPKSAFGKVYADIYDFCSWPVTSLFSLIIINELGKLPSNSKVLEIGMGTGSILIKSAQKLPSSFTFAGIDPSEHMLTKAKYRVDAHGLSPRVTLTTGTIEDIPFESAIFDGVVICSLFRYLYPERLDDYMEEVSRVIKSGGTLIIADLILPLTGAFKKGLSKNSINYVILGIWSMYSPESISQHLVNFNFFRTNKYSLPASTVLVFEKLPAV